MTQDADRGGIGGFRGPGAATRIKLLAGAAAVLLAAGAGAALGLRGQTVADRQPAPHPGSPGPTTTSVPSSTTTTSGTVPKVPVHTAALVHYGTCSQVLSGIKAEALAEVGPYGLANDRPQMFAGGAAASGAASPAPEASSSNSSAGSDTAAGGSSAPTSYSATNNQEAGVDEPDVTKTDGHLLLVLRHNPVGLQVVDVSGSSPHLDGFLALGQAGYSQLFLDGTYAIVLGSSQWPTPEAGASPGAKPGAPNSGSAGPGSSGPAEPAQPVAPSGSATQAVVVSLANPSHPSVVRTFTLQGDEVGARLVGGHVLVVLRNQPLLAWSYPSDGSAAAQAASTSRNQALVRSSTLPDWLPSTTVAPGGAHQLSSCAAALHPQVASGLDTVSVASLDPSGSQTTPEVTVVGNADTVYASTDTLYVATNPWTVQMEELAPAPAPGVTPPTLTTDIHAFDISDPTRPTYLGSGTVPGTLIGQYALSEYQGNLRVASTVGLPTPPPREGTAPSQPSDNIVSVLARQGNAMVTIGSVGGLGQGEKIYGVRFMGALGYVVTFRQTDPLYVVDLSVPTSPVVDGELPLTGYSSFLQPLGGSLLLGVGSSVDSNLRVTGLQLSVFDVSHPASPALRSKLELNGASSSAQGDPHALLWWPSSRLVAMPVTQYDYQYGGPAPAPQGSGSSADNNQPFNGVIVWHVGSDGTLTEVARLSQPQPQSQNPPCDNCGASSSGAATAPSPGGGAMYYPYGGMGIERALVISNDLYTVSDAGVMANSMSGWSRVAWLAFNGS